MVLYLGLIDHRVIGKKFGIYDIQGSENPLVRLFSMTYCQNAMPSVMAIVLGIRMAYIV